jgi:hypothetical protein
VFWSEDAARRSLARIVDRCTFVYPGHDRAFRIHNGGFSYIETTRISISGLPDMPDGMLGASFTIGAPRGIDVRPTALPAGAIAD